LRLLQYRQRSKTLDSMMPKTILVCDMDGVICDAMTNFIMAVWDKYRVLITYNDINQFDCTRATYLKVKERSKFPPKDFDDYNNYMVKVCFWNPYFYESMLPRIALWEPISQFPDRTIFMTSRHPGMRITTENWLSKYGFVVDHPDDVMLRGDKWVQIEKIAEKNPDARIVFIDDKMKTAIKVGAMKLPQVERIFVPGRPWNDPTESEENQAEYQELVALGKGHRVKILPDQLMVRELYETFYE